MTTYYVEIQAGNREGTYWQTVHPVESVTDWDGTAQELADWTASNQNVADGDCWRVRVYDTDDPHADPVGEHHHEPPQPTQRYELEAWLGPALEELTAEQVDQLHRESDRIGERYPDQDDQDLRDAALSAATQYLLGETSIDDAGRVLTDIRLRETRAYAAAYQIATLAAEAGMPEAEVARRAGIDRMTVRKIMGKR